MKRGARRAAPQDLPGVAWSLAIAACAVFLVGCGHSSQRAVHEWAIPTNRPRAAFLPLENLTPVGNAAEVVTRVFFTELTRTGTVELVEPGNVDAALEALRIRATGSPTTGQYAALGESLGVAYVFAGSLLEAGRVSTPDGDVPTVGAAVRMVEAKTGRIVWAGVQFRTGDDHESVFGWGRVRNSDQLAGELAQHLFQDFEEVGRKMAEASKSAGEKK